MKNKISVLIPCYNSSVFLSRLFKNLKELSNKNINLIFLNDKSTDNTLSLLEDFKKENQTIFDIEIFSLEQNRGVAFARNFLISKVKTEYFYFIDPDDLLYKNTFDYFYEIINKEQYEIVLAKSTIATKDGFVVFDFLNNYWKMGSSGKNKHLIFLKNGLGFPWNKLINTEWYRSLNISFLENTSYEDFPVVFFMLLSTTKSFYLKKNTYKYYWNPNSLSKKIDVSKIYFIAQNMHKFHNMLIDSNKLEEYQEYEKSFFLITLKHAFSNKTTKHILNNFDTSKQMLAESFDLFEKINIENKFEKYKKHSFLLKTAIKNYFLLKNLIKKQQT